MTPIKIHQWDQQCGVTWPREKGFLQCTEAPPHEELDQKKTQKNDTKRPPRFHLPDPLLAFPQPWRMEKIKTSKKKTAFNPRKQEGKKQVVEGKKSTAETLSKKWLFGLFWLLLRRVQVEESKWRTKSEKKEVCKDRKMLFGEKSWQRGLRHVSDVWAHVQLNKNTAKGGKMFGCLVGRKKGHMICYGQKIRKIIQKQWNRR